MELIRNYHLSGEIVIAADAPKNEAYAAAELRYYFNRMTSYPARIQPADEPREEAVIVIGGALPLYGEALESYADDELHWYVKDGRIFFDGGCRGLLYGVYDFLETMGCRFFTPECERVPTVADYTVAETDRRDKPALEYRNFYYSDTLDNPRFGAKSCARCSVAGCPKRAGT